MICHKTNWCASNIMNITPVVLEMLFLSVPQLGLEWEKFSQDDISSTTLWDLVKKEFSDSVEEKFSNKPFISSSLSQLFSSVSQL